jgi:hypothetical protein
VPVAIKIRLDSGWTWTATLAVLGSPLGCLKIIARSFDNDNSRVREKIYGFSCLCLAESPPYWKSSMQCLDAKRWPVIAVTRRPDIGLPVMDGYAVCRAFRQDDLFRDALIIAQTGWGQQRDKSLAPILDKWPSDAWRSHNSALTDPNRPAGPGSSQPARHPSARSGCDHCRLAASFRMQT